MNWSGYAPLRGYRADRALNERTYRMDFIQFPKIARFSREVIVTEKIDGTNAQVFIRELPDDQEMPTDTPIVAVRGGHLLYAGSRSRWITPKEDNHGWARWVAENADELVKLGPGNHFGEWWGSGIQRGYGLPKGEKRFSLFNVARWEHNPERPACCHVVPVICRPIAMEYLDVGLIMSDLKDDGSLAAPGFMKPEGIVIFHAQGNVAFKKTFDKDDAGKGREPVAQELTRAA